jgi:protein O-mannosyl-transferase
MLHMQKKKSKHSAPEKKHSPLIFYLIIITAGFLVYSNSFHAPFTFDDNEIIVKNQALQDNSVFSQCNKPRYIGFITFAINYHINGLNTFGYHIVNIIIHIMNALLVYLLIQELLLLSRNQNEIPFQDKIPLIISLLFLVHPVQTQAITYIVQRFTSLAAFFSLIAILSYMKFRTLKSKSYFYLIISIISCLCAYKTKENTAALPLILIAIELLFFRDQKSVKERITYLIPCFLLILVIPLSFAHSNQSAGEFIGELTKASAETQTISRAQYFYTEMSVIATYIRLMLVPINQAIDYSWALSQSFFEARVFLPLLLFTAMLIAAVLIAKKYPIISFGIVWFFIFLVVESSIIPIKDVIFEHRLYLPSIGFIIASVYSLFLFETKLKWKYVAMGFCMAVILVFAIAAYARNQLWNDQMALWKDAADKFPQNGRAIGNYAIMLADLWKCTEAMPLLQKGIELAPHNRRIQKNT